MDWDAKHSDDDFEDDPSLESFNADEIAEFIYLYLQSYTLFFRSNHLLMVMGNDFTYMNAYENFDSTDRFIKYFNKLYGEEY